QLAELALQRRNFLGHVELTITGEPFQLVDLSFQLENGLLKVQRGRGHNGYVRPLSALGRDVPGRDRAKPVTPSTRRGKRAGAASGSEGARRRYRRESAPRAPERRYCRWSAFR